jgi:uncharacterized protein DUF4242
VATFVIESYMSRTGTGELDAAAARLRAAIAEMPESAGRVRYLRSMFVPDDEICFHVIEAPSHQVAVDAAGRAGLTPDRVVKAEAAAG